MQDSRSLLIIDSDPTFRANAARFLTERGFVVSDASTGQAGAELARRLRPEYVLLDLAVQQPRAAELIEMLSAGPEKPRIVCVASGARVADVVAAVRAGALDVMERPVDGERLVRLYERAPRAVSQPQAVVAPPVPMTKPVRVTHEPELDPLATRSDAVKAALNRLARLAEVETAVVVEGEPGCGQESFARHFHGASARAAGPFVVVPSHPEGSTAEDALFGSTATVSAFARAKGGVVFVESLLSLGATGQERLAKLLQGLAAARVGGSTVRWPPMIIGLERPLAAEVESGRVRKDLAGYLARTTVSVPPLRARKEDLPEVIQGLVTAIQIQVGATASAVSPAVMEVLVAREWQGNFPELVATVCRAAAYDEAGRVVLDLTPRFEPSPVVDADSFDEEMQASLAPPSAEEEEDDDGDEWEPTLDERGRVQPYDVYEAQIFRFALKNAGGCVSRAAELLGVGRATMYRKMRAYDIDVPPVSERSIARTRRVKKRAVSAPGVGLGASRDFVS
jgi:DNA-binding NtrC family response regulator